MVNVKSLLLERLDILQIVRDYLGEGKKVGKQYAYLSPFKAERTPSFFVEPNKGIFKCFASGHGGNAIKFVELLEKVSEREAMVILAKKYAPDLLAHLVNGSLDNLMLEIVDLCHKYLHEHKDAYDYLRRRGVEDRVIKELRIGYLGDLSGLIGKYDNDVLLGSKFFTVDINNVIRQRYRNGIIIPRIVDGKVLFCNVRILDGSDARYYMIKVADDFAVHTLGDVFSSLNVYLTEGIFDAISLYQMGFAVIALNGVNNYDRVLDMLRGKVVVMCFDNDEAGRDISLKAGYAIIRYGGLPQVLRFDKSCKDINEVYVKGLINKEYVLNNQVSFVEYAFSEGEDKYVVIQQVLERVRSDWGYRNEFEEYVRQAALGGDFSASYEALKVAFVSYWSKFDYKPIRVDNLEKRIIALIVSGYQFINKNNISHVLPLFSVRSNSIDLVNLYYMTVNGSDVSVIKESFKDYDIYNISSYDVFISQVLQAYHAIEAQSNMSVLLGGVG